MLSDFTGLIVIAAVGTAGWLLFKKLGLPLPALLGSLFAAGALAVSGHFPNASLGTASFLCKAAIGVMMGRRINRSSVRLLGALAMPAVLICVWMIAASLVSGFVLYFASPLPLSTALIGCAAGGVAEMAIFAMSQHHDVATVTFIQVFRLVVVLVMTPYIIKKWKGKFSAAPAAEPAEDELRDDCEPLAHFSYREMALLIPAALACGYAFERLGVPAGAMIGSLVATAVGGLAANRIARFSVPVRTAAQIGIGAVIAKQIDAATLLALAKLLPAIALSTAILVASSVALAFALQRLTRWDATTCLLSTSAGGLSQMVVVAEEMHADSLRIGVLHLARYLAIIGGMPFFITWFLR